MSSTSPFTCASPYSVSEDQLLWHARYLSKMCGLQLHDAREMLAYRHFCRSWHQLIRLAKEQLLPIEAFNSLPHADDDQSVRIKEKLKCLLSGNHSDQVSNSLGPLEPGAIAHTISTTSLDKLTLEESFLLLNYFETNLPEVKVASTAQLIDCLTYLDTSITSQIKFDGYKNLQRGNVEDWRFLLAYYYNIRTSGSCIDLIIRECDLYLTHPAVPYLHDQAPLFECSWLPKYIWGYMQKIIKQLKAHNFSGRILLQRVNTTDLCPQGAKVAPLRLERSTNFTKHFVENGAKFEPLKDPDYTWGLAIRF
ncbi:hypothetical protein [Microbulbifer discodermiae]|uniref:hypothetical protein n=1 Tax=Microbulbifer sp. 2201CG32-9 TaxID=3232309 RepID=UPI00345C41D9